MLITGHDYAFDVPDTDLVKIAFSEIKRSGQNPTLLLISQVSGLDVSVVRECVKQIVAEQQAKAK